VKRRILTATLSVTVVTLLVFGIPLAWALGRFYRSQELSRLHQAATVAAAAVPSEGLHGSDPIEPPAVPSGVHLAYYDAQAQLVAGTGPPRATPIALEALAGRPADGSDGSREVSALPIVANETTIGALEASSSRAALAWRTQRAWLGMLALGVVALAAAALVALWQARRLTRPVDDLVEAAERLGDGEFNVTATYSGVAEIDRARDAMAATSARLGCLLTRERAFTAHASHQLRTPLTALRLSLENALVTPGVDIESAIGDAVGDVDRLEATLDQLFRLARSGSTPASGLAGRTVPVAEVLDAVERRWHPVLAQAGRRFQVSESGLGECSVPASLAQVLDILIDNSVKHGRGKVALSARPVAGGFSVAVEDEGDGLATLPVPATGPAGSAGPVGLTGPVGAAGPVGPT
jgi:signal transduction histidine kinase